MSIELPVATRHRRDMIEKLLKATLNPNSHTHTYYDTMFCFDVFKMYDLGELGNNAFCSGEQANMDRWFRDLLLFQQYFSHIRTMEECIYQDKKIPH